MLRRLLLLPLIFLATGIVPAHAAPEKGQQNGDDDATLNHVPSTSFPSAHGIKTADAVNFILLGTQEQLVQAFTDARWKVASPLGFKSSFHEVLDSLKECSYPSAPVSTQYLFHKPQDIAFELEEGNATKRHHIRFWQLPGHPDEWVGAATEDVGLLIELRKGVISHKTNGKIDLERQFVVKTLEGTCGKELRQARLRDVKITRLNAQGVRYFTDGELEVMSAKGCKPTQSSIDKSAAVTPGPAPTGTGPCP